MRGGSQPVLQVALRREELDGVVRRSPGAPGGGESNTNNGDGIRILAVRDLLGCLTVFLQLL